MSTPTETSMLELSAEEISQITEILPEPLKFLFEKAQRVKADIPNHPEESGFHIFGTSSYDVDIIAVIMRWLMVALKHSQEHIGVLSDAIDELPCSDGFVDENDQTWTKTKEALDKLTELGIKL